MARLGARMRRSVTGDLRVSPEDTFDRSPSVAEHPRTLVSFGEHEPACSPARGESRHQLRSCLAFVTSKANGKRGHWDRSLSIDTLDTW